MARFGGAAGASVASITRGAGRLFVLVVASTTLRAQVPARAVTDGVPTNAPHWRWDHCLAGITYGGPQKLAVAWGGGLVREGVGEHGADDCAFGAAKLGPGGARAAIGLGRSSGPLGSGLALSVDVLRTFAAPLGASAKRTYVGVAVHLWPVIGLDGEIGYFVRLGDAAGSPSAQRHVITWSTGFGF